MKTFLRQSHLPKSIGIAFGAILLCVFITFLSDISFVEMLLMLFVVIIFSGFLIKYIYQAGLYIDGTNIYYKNFQKKQVDVNKIAAIKIVRATSEGGKYSNGSNLKSVDGKQLYSMLFLKEYMEWWMPQQKEMADCHFRANFGEYVLCSCVYDQSVIDYLLTLNPNIIVF